MEGKKQRREVLSLYDDFPQGKCNIKNIKFLNFID